MLLVFSLLGKSLGFLGGFGSLFLGLFDLLLSPLIDLGNFLLCRTNLRLMAALETLNRVLSLLLEFLLLPFGTFLKFLCFEFSLFFGLHNSICRLLNLLLYLLSHGGFLLISLLLSIFN